MELVVKVDEGPFVSVGPATFITNHKPLDGFLLSVVVV
jgi:hypothetical protein